VYVLEFEVFEFSSLFPERIGTLDATRQKMSFCEFLGGGYLAEWKRFYFICCMLWKTSVVCIFCIYHFSEVGSRKAEGRGIKHKPFPAIL
jgi:hypothetical protein